MCTSVAPLQAGAGNKYVSQTIPYCGIKFWRRLSPFLADSAARVPCHDRVRIFRDLTDDSLYVIVKAASSRGTLSRGRRVGDGISCVRAVFRYNEDLKSTEARYTFEENIPWTFHMVRNHVNERVMLVHCLFFSCLDNLQTGEGCIRGFSNSQTMICGLIYYHKLSQSHFLRDFAHE